MFRRSWIVFGALTILLCPPLIAQSPEKSQAENSEPQAETGQRYLLRYKLAPGEQLHYEVVHVAKTKTRIGGSEETSQVHTISQRHLQVTERNENRITFDHIIDAVEMTQRQGDDEETRWDSEQSEPPPAMFQPVADRIGKTLSTVTVNARGEELDRQDNGATKASLGMGSLTISLPEEPIAVGQSWSVPHQMRVRGEDGKIQTIKIRQRYTLKKVSTGVATLEVRSEPLTPIKSESIRAQLVQQLSNGTIRFDIDNGRMLSKQLDWDETVVGFQGANSLMEYRAQLKERLMDQGQRTARRQ